MTINQLRYFVSVADTGHLTRSAQNLLMAQPSLTQSIKKLEEELGFPLFIKKGKSIGLCRPAMRTALLDTENLEFI